mmetsp:Transcript_44056/g.126198  ORF Transcript_44056/g.126198 Transcript_44056/m.126198 type:complete len:385 (+) Transcript_44056:185-1339(+)
MVEGCARPITPHLHLILAVVVLAVKMPSMDGEAELGGTLVLELVFVIQAEVGTHERHPGVFPCRFIEYNLARAAKVVLVPIQKLLLELFLVQASVPVPPAHRLRHVWGREGHEESRDGHGQTHLPRQYEELEGDPGAHRVAPHDVGHAVANLLVEDGEQIRAQRLGGLVLLGLQQLVSAGEIKGADLNGLAFLGPLREGRVRAGEVGLRAAGIVEAEDSQLDFGQRVAEHLVLHQVHREGILLLLLSRHPLDLLLQGLVHLHGPAVLTWTAHIVRCGRGSSNSASSNACTAVLFDEEVLAGNLQAHPAHGGPRACDQLVAQSLSLQLHLLNNGACGHPILAGRRLEVLALPDKDATFVRATNDLPLLANNHGSGDHSRLPCGVD